MHADYRIKPLKTLGWWVACSLFVWPMSLIVTAMIALPGGLFLGALNPLFPNAHVMEDLIVFLLVPLVGTIIGGCIGVLQRWILRNKLYWAADGWRRWSMIGGGLGAITVSFIVGLMSTPHLRSVIRPELMNLSMMPIFLAIVSAFQAVPLRQAVRQSWLWVIANSVAGIVFAGVLMGNQPAYTDPQYSLIMLGIMGLAVTSLGFITGTVIIFLFEKCLLPMRPENDDEGEDTRRKSIWDRAI